MSDSLTKVMTNILLIVNLILTVMVCNMVFGLRQQMSRLGEPITKSDLIAVAAPTMEMSFMDKCTRCHSEKRFADVPTDELHLAVLQMQKLPDTNITDSDVAKIEASLALRDFSADTLRQMVLMPDTQRLETIGQVKNTPGSAPITQEEARQILQAYKTLLGL